ncbi:ABC transporter permease [Treponema sp.]|uniref:ABC transporter permease n=1 Tax=Treponema sp. TaxID=166 RepID=UPI00388D22B9
MTRQRMYFKMITSSLMRRRSRMIVALLAVAIGSTILSGLVTIYYDVPRQMGQEFRSYGANLLLVSSGTENLKTENVNYAKDLIPSGKLVGLTPFRYETIKINNQPFLAAGTDFQMIRKTSPYWLVSGKYPESAAEILAGQTVANGTALSAGGKIAVTGVDSNGKAFSQTFTVSGILQTGGNEEECIYMNLSKLEELMKDFGTIDIAECSVSATGSELESISKTISENVSGINAKLVKRLAKSEGTVLKKLQSLVYIVTLVVLILTMVCVATTMMAVVAERRKEIGLKKSLGASNQSIVVEFLGEGLFLGALGGILGVILGFGFAQAVSINVFARSISFQPLLIPVTIIVSVAVTGLACLIPVKSATEVDPALVLKGE